MKIVGLMWSSSREMDDTYTSSMLVPLLPFRLKAIKTSCDLLLQACDLAKLRDPCVFAVSVPGSLPRAVSRAGPDQARQAVGPAVRQTSGKL